MRMSRAIWLSTVFALISISGSAAAQDETAELLAQESDRIPRPESRGEPSQSVSVGLTNAGSVAHSVELADTETLFVKHGSTDTRWGTAELVAMVERAANSVAATHPGSRLTVGDLSRRHGGRAHPHRSHRAGRDVDIGFYVTDLESGDEIVVDRFINMSRGGRGRDQRGRQYRFDVERNWALMASILEDDRIDVQFVLINPAIRRALIRHARSEGVDAELRERFSIVSARRSGSASHRSHFHVRIYCPVDDRPRCVDAPPYHPFVFTSEEETQKRLAEWREFTPPRRAAPRRRRARRRGRMQRHAMRSRMTMMQRGMRGSMGASMRATARARTMRRGGGGMMAGLAASTSGDP